MGDFASTTYSKRWQKNLDRRIVAPSITNDDYTVTGARTVEVWQANDLSSNDLNGDGSVQIQQPSGGTTTITMDQEKDLTVGIPSVEQFQSSVDMREKFRGRQVQQEGEDIDDYVFSLYSNGNVSVDTTATSNASDFVAKLREAKVTLSDNNVPRSGRYAVLSPHYIDLVTEEAGDSLQTNSDILTEGYIGRYQGFDLYESSALATTSGTPGKVHCLVGHAMGVTLATQLNEFSLVENTEQVGFHGDVLKGLLVYGAKVIEPDAFGVINADQPA